MTEEDCRSCRAVAAELALGIAVGDERAAALEHLSDCASCRRELDGLTATLDALVSVAPTMEPTAGFADRVMAEFSGAGDVDLDPFPVAPVEQAEQVEQVATVPPPVRRRRVGARAVLAFAAALVVLCGVGVAVRAAQEDPPLRSGEVASAPDGPLRGVLTAPDGTGVGRVTLDPRRPEGAGAGSELVVTLGAGVPAGSYRVECDYESGRPYTAGTLSATAEGPDRWSGTVSVPTYDLRRVRLVSTTGGPNLEADMTT